MSDRLADLVSALEDAGLNPGSATRIPPTPWTSLQVVGVANEDFCLRVALSIHTHLVGEDWPALEPVDDAVARLAEVYDSDPSLAFVSSAPLEGATYGRRTFAGVVVVLDVLK